MAGLAFSHLAEGSSRVRFIRMRTVLTMTVSAHLTADMPGRGREYGRGLHVTRVWPSSLTGFPSASLSSTQ